MYYLRGERSIPQDEDLVCDICEADFRNMKPAFDALRNRAGSSFKPVGNALELNSTALRTLLQIIVDLLAVQKDTDVAALERLNHIAREAEAKELGLAFYKDDITSVL